MADSSLTGKIVWHELMANDPKQAAAFYTSIAHWRAQASSMAPDYTELWAPTGAVGGLMGITNEMRAGGARPGWVIYVATADLDATLALATQLGGRICKEPMSIPGVGRFAFLADPQGAMFAVIAPAGPENASAPSGVGAFTWVELPTTDPDGACAFYQKLFGWQKSAAHDMGPMGIYQLISRNGIDIGGICRKQAQQPGPTQWLSYSMVPSAADAASQVKAAGGTVIHGPAQVPGGTWITICLDPTGTMFAVMSAATVAAAKPKAAAPKEKAAPKPKAASKPKAVAAAKAAPKKKKAAKKKATKPVRAKPKSKAKSKKTAKSKVKAKAKRSAKKPARRAVKRAKPKKRPARKK
jgi:predicted enzyme related to lactoylglutathione lyase